MAQTSVTQRHPNIPQKRYSYLDLLKITCLGDVQRTVKLLIP